MNTLDAKILGEVDAGTPMGNMLRKFWWPVAMAADVAEPDGPQVRVKVLGENLILFRDTDNRLGLIDEFCPHRRVSLFYGRNEQCGLRCGYHGWKFDVDGNCVEVPFERDNPAFSKKIKIKHYKAVALGRVVWAYMGDPAEEPPLPGWDFCKLPDDQTFVSKSAQDCHWLQALEGNIDPEHVLWLHRGDMFAEPEFDGIGDHKPIYVLRETEFGLINAPRREARNGNYFYRVIPWVFPAFIGVAIRYGGPVSGRFWVPIDDKTTMVWTTDHHPTRSFNRSIHVRNIPGTDIPIANKSNEYQMDRKIQEIGFTSTGIQTIQLQDRSLQESMGALVDRTEENLCGSDNSIILARKRLLNAAKNKDETPPGLDPEHHKIWQMQLIIPKDQDFLEEIRRRVK